MPHIDRRGLTVLTIVLVLASATLVGCSCEISADTSEAGTADTESVERLIATELTQQSGVSPRSVDCPAEMALEEGRRYECTVVHPRDGALPIDVTMQADGGFEWLVRSAGS